MGNNKAETVKSSLPLSFPFPTPTIMTFIANATLREQQALSKLAIQQLLPEQY